MDRIHCISRQFPGLFDMELPNHTSCSQIFRNFISYAVNCIYLKSILYIPTYSMQPRYVSRCQSNWTASSDLIHPAPLRTTKQTPPCAPSFLWTLPKLFSGFKTLKICHWFLCDIKLLVWKGRRMCKLRYVLPPTEWYFECLVSEKGGKKEANFWRIQSWKDYG